MRRLRHLFAWLGGLTFIVLGGAIVAALVYRATVVSRLSGELFATQKTLTDTPETYGVAYRALTLDSHGRKLGAWLVDAGAGTPAVLIFNGNGLNRSAFAEAQAYLFRHHISSMTFDYSGYGTSSGTATVAHLQQDGDAAWRSLATWADGTRPLYVLGYSLGTGVAMHDAPAFVPQPRGVILYGAFSSAKSLVGYIAPAIPKVLVALMPDVWDNVMQAARLRQPLLVVAGMDDVQIPPINGRQVALFARGGHDFVLIPGADHGGILSEKPAIFDAVWQPIIAFIARHAAAPPAAASTPTTVPVVPATAASAGR
ncbi:MAG TPA: alpha/beta hydrolase [Rhodanobacteraceae bacterium]